MDATVVPAGLRRLGMISCALVAAAALIGVASPARAARAPASYHVFSVSCPAASNCTAVGGTSAYPGTSTPLAWIWRNGKWTVAKAGRRSVLLAVSCRYRTQCTAVGETKTQRALALRWNGTSWTGQPTPSTGSGAAADSRLSGITCPAAKICIAVGVAGGDSLGERWNGIQWSIHGVGVPGTGSALSGVGCPTDPILNSLCMAVGSYLTDQDTDQPLDEDWNAFAWVFEPTPAAPDGSSLAATSCLLWYACWAVGSSPTGSGPPVPLAEAWNGKFWRILPTPPHPDAYARFNGLSCSPAQSCIAVGMACRSAGACSAHARTGFSALAERWNGTTWTILRLSQPDVDLDSVSCTSRQACTAVGDGPSGPVAERWNGRTWRRQDLPG